jgi:tRNA G10  N-methylase Trm11
MKSGILVMTTKHPAIMGNHLLEVCKKFLPSVGARVLDPFAGIGTTAKLLPEYDVVGVEIEKEWADQEESTICGDSLSIVPTLGLFDAVLTSPAYGNRMADDFNASSPTSRITYRHRLGRPLSQSTTANLHFGRKNSKYEDLHEKIWKVCVEALTPGGVFILNSKDFIANGETQEVTDWHLKTLQNLGLEVISQEKVSSRGMRFGANRDKRIDYEWVVALSKIR